MALRSAQLPLPGMGRTLTKFEWKFDPPVPAFIYSFNRYADLVDDFSPLFDVLHERFKTAMADQFRSEGAYSADRWEELTPKYRRWKEAHYGDLPIGELTGSFKRAMTRDSMDHYYYKDSSSAVMGLAEWANSDPRGRLHIYGPVFQYGRVVNGYQPPRQVINMPPAEARAWQRRTHEFVYWASQTALPMEGMTFVGGRTLGTAEKFSNLQLPED